MPVDHTKNIIEIKNVCFAYSGDQWVLRNINLDVHQGDYLGIIGPNGGGKTTLLKIMLGLLKPQEGTVKLFVNKIGYVPQKAVNFDVNFPLTVKEVVTMGRYGEKGLLKSLDKNDEVIIKKSLDQVEMWGYRDKIIGDLSGGQEQRVFIARALATRPEVVILDEPTTGVDEQSQKKFYALLKKLNEELNLTLILVSHDSNVIVHEVTEIACINKTIVYTIDPKNFLKMKYHKH